jgi:hypothetical protein
MVKWLGSEGTAYLLRIDAGPTEFNLQQVVTNTTGGSGEGELAVTSSTSAASEVQPPAAAAQLASATVASSLSGADDSVAEIAVPVTPTGEGEPSAAQDPVFTMADAATSPAVTSSTAAESVADVGWFVPLFDDGYAAGTEAESVTVAGADARTFGDQTAAIDAVLAQEDFAAAGPDSDPIVKVASSEDADDYAAAIDALLAEDAVVLAEAI